MRSVCCANPTWRATMRTQGPCLCPDQCFASLQGNLLGACTGTLSPSHIIVQSRKRRPGARPCVCVEPACAERWVMQSKLAFPFTRLLAISHFSHFPAPPPSRYPFQLLASLAHPTRLVTTSDVSQPPTRHQPSEALSCQARWRGLGGLLLPDAWV